MGAEKVGALAVDDDGELGFVSGGGAGAGGRGGVGGGRVDGAVVGDVSGGGGWVFQLGVLVVEVSVLEKGWESVALLGRCVCCWIHLL